MEQNNKNFDVIVLAAGKGVRMKSELPKVLHKLCGLTLLERTLRSVSALGPLRIIVVVGYGAELTSSQVKTLSRESWANNIDFVCVEQKEQLGTGHAVITALPELSDKAEEVLIVPGDAPLLSTRSLASFLKNSVGYELAILSSFPPIPYGFGRIVRNQDNNVQKIVEEKDCTEGEREVKEINTSIYFVNRVLLSQALKTLKTDNIQKEYYLTDIVNYAVKKQKKVEALPLKDFRDGQGVNSRFELSGLEKMKREEIIKQLMENGVSFEDPSNVYIDEDVKIGTDCFIGSGVRLKGKTEIANRVTIQGDAVVSDSKIGTGSTIKYFTIIEQAEVDSNCEVGPFARLRPQTKLEQGVHVGNFVELKKAELQKGVKANHLSYLGDATIGENTNVGAGTITCNYDGVNKHQTIIGKEVFIGSNTALVAPVKVGDGALIGAGSVITNDIPADALGLERAELKIIEGWAKKKKDKLLAKKKNY